MTMDYRPDPDFRKAFLRTAGVEAVARDLASSAAALAALLAPDDPATTTNDLPSSVTFDVGLTARGWVGRVLATDWKAHFYEYGTSRRSPRPFLRPAVESEVGPLSADARGADE